MGSPDSAEYGIGHAVEHLSGYYRHLATVSAGAIVVIGTFASDLAPPGANSVAPAIAFVSLGVCILVSTYMMWVYGVARRQVARLDAGSDAAWAYNVEDWVLTLAKRFVLIGSVAGPLSFVVGFIALALYAAQLL
jgi:hypothetical protein